MSNPEPASSLTPGDSAPETPPSAKTQEETREEVLESLRKALREEGSKHGVTPEHIDSWKQTYGQVAAFPIGEDVYFVRPLSRKEWRDFQKLRLEQAQSNPGIDMDIEEKIAVRACLFPKIDEIASKSTIPAGVPSTIAEAVSNLSGFMPGVQPIIL